MVDLILAKNETIHVGAVITEGYEHFLYKMYIKCVQWKKTIIEYTIKFLHFCERKELGELDIQKVPWYINGLKGSLQEKIGLPAASK